MAYILDSDVFIQAKNFHYRMEVVEGFWKWLDIACSNGVIFSIDEVRKELLDRGDKLSLWGKTRKKMFLSTKDSKTYESFGILATWVGEHYQPAFQAQFFNDADFSLVGFAHAHNHIVVTHEVRSGAGGKEVKIPNACDAMQVEVINPFELLTKEKVKFDLRT
jgi:hypothetical protein